MFFLSGVGRDVGLGVPGICNRDYFTATTLDVGERDAWPPLRATTYHINISDTVT